MLSLSSVAAGAESQLEEVLGSSAPAEYPVPSGGRRLSLPRGVDHLAAVAGQIRQQQGSLARMPLKASRWDLPSKGHVCHCRRSMEPLRNGASQLLN